MNNPNDQNKSKDEQANGERDGWTAEELSKQASQQDEDEIQRQLKRGGERQDDANDRDDAGTSASKDTPQGREEAKNNMEGKANDNG